MEFLSAAFVIAILVLLVIVSAVAWFLCLLAGKTWPAVGWLISILVCTGLLYLTTGGF